LPLNNEAYGTITITRDAVAPGSDLRSDGLGPCRAREEKDPKDDESAHDHLRSMRDDVLVVVGVKQL